MKILRLDLVAFGPFTGEALALDDGHYGLHVVCGPNEAGKSSALRALQQFLYGIPHNSSDNFVHSHQNLRIGALLESADGTQLECIRRKGRSKTLRGADDAEVIDQAQLAEMLGAVDEAAFSQRFGIDYAELRKGGEAILQGGGDLGDILFAAGAGVADLGPVQKRLADETDELFKPRGSAQKINKAISEFAAARREIKDSQLLTSDWVKHDKALRNACKRKEEIDQKLLDMKSEKSRLRRIADALPQIAQRDPLQNELQDVADAPILSEGFSESRREAVTELKRVQQTKQDAAKAIDELEDTMTNLEPHLPEGLLEHRTVITELHTELGSYRKAAKDRPGLMIQQQQAEDEARAILQDLGHEPELGQSEQLRLSRTQRQRLQSLAGECKALLTEQESTSKAARKLRGDISSAEKQLAKTPRAQDAREFQQAIRRAQKLGDLDKRLAASRTELRQLEEQAQVNLERLRLWTGNLTELEKLPVPAAETIERFENQLADAAAAVTTQRERIDEYGEEAQGLDQTLEKLRLEQDVPTEEDLTQAREYRDAGWQLVREAWLDQADSNDEAVAFIEQFGPDGDLATAFQRSLEAADHIGDRLRREADRVAEKTKLTADRQDLERRLADLNEKLGTSQQHLTEVQETWRKQWEPVRVDPLPPREMRSWASKQAALVGAAEAIRKQRGMADETEQLIQAHRVELSDCLAELGQPTSSDDESFAAVVDRCEDVVAQIESIARDRQQLESDLARLRGQLPDTEQAAAEATHSLEEWRKNWGAAVKRLGLEEDAAPNEVNTVLESVDDLFAKLKEAGDKRQRVEGIDRDAKDFTENVRRLTEQVASDLTELPVEQAIADLYDRLNTAVRAQARFDELQNQLRREEAKRDEARIQLKQWQTKLDMLCQEAGCDSSDDLPEVERRSARRQELEGALRTLEEQLSRLAAGAVLDDFVAEALEFNPDQVEATIDRLTDDIQELENEKTEVSETIGSERSELSRMDGSGQAAEAQEQAEHLLARIRSDAEQYVRLRLASVVLQRSIERFREKSQGPVLQRASGIFSELTLGSFEGLRADYNDKGDAVLMGVRPGGRLTVGVQGMSDGTSDQLYLALRLALLEAYLAHREPVPFIVDDILIMFDDDRAVAALRTLARLSEQTQVVFFTHHRHLVGLAEANLDDGVLFTHEFNHSDLAPVPSSAKA